jgi:hypothetical protein
MPSQKNKSISVIKNKYTIKKDVETLRFLLKEADELIIPFEKTFIIR